MRPIQTVWSGAAIGLCLFFLACHSNLPSSPSGASGGLLEGIASGATRVVDLSHSLNARTPYWPGEGNRPFHFEYFTSLAKDHVLEGHFTADEHTGTHIDAPNHFIAGQMSLDQIPPERFFVPIVVIDVRTNASANPDYVLTAADADNWEKANGPIPANAMVMMYSGWEKHWDDFNAYKNADAKGVLHFPGFSAAAARILIEGRNAAGLGIDTLSIDTGSSPDYPAHVISHGRGKFNLENVGNLGLLPPKGAYLIAAPMKIEGGTGSPVRLYALVAAASAKGR